MVLAFRSRFRTVVLSDTGNMVTRSFPPLPTMTAIALRDRFMS